MAEQQQQYRLKLDSVDLKNFEKVEAEVEGVEGAKVLLLKVGDQLHAMGSKCTHYGAPLVKGVVTPDGRLTCPWHGGIYTWTCGGIYYVADFNSLACFAVSTGDVEDSPALDPLMKYPLTQRDGSIYITTDEASLKAGRRSGDVKCEVQSDEKVVIVGGGSGTMGALEGLRKGGFKGSITVISREPYPPIDRTKLSKAMIPDATKVILRGEDWFKNASVDHYTDQVAGVDFSAKTVQAISGKTYPYTKLILATGGTPKRLPLPGFKDLNNVFTLRTIPDVQAILGAIGETKNKKIVVVGSSFIGMEVSNCLSKDNQVTVVGRSKEPLAQVLGERVGSVFRGQLEKSGVKFHLSAGVEKALPSSDDSKNVGAVHLQDGTDLPADIVLLAVGVAPATEYLKDNPAITLEKDGSLKTDSFFSLADQGQPDVYAIGDIATYPYQGPGGNGIYTRIEHWNVAQNGGRAVGAHITGARKEPKPFIPIFWSAMGKQLRYCGNAPNGYDDLVIKGNLDETTFSAFYTKDDTVVAVATVQMDPVMTKSAELMRRGNMPSKKDLQNGVDVLDVQLPAEVKIPVR
ncbi:MAG: hypothetical protein M1816_003532 [Peltula sp. TS41687]|nr:MAG: hypothetical protein M1816_003532 [Peltula sp. TS41687]